MATMVTVAGYIWGEMTTNVSSPVVARISTLLSGGGLDYPLRYYQACELWANQVGSRRPWDHKPHIESTYGQWSTDTASRRDYFFDIWSNIHYGYVGRAASFSTWVLRSGAGAAQVRARTVPPGYWSRRFEVIGDADVFAAFDDPRDQAAIIIGAELWETHGRALTLQQLVTKTRANASRLTTRTRTVGP